MADKSKIEWTDATWSPVTGCSPCSPGCQHCYAEALCRRFWRQWDRDPPPDHFKVRLHPRRLNYPMDWKSPSRIFVCSMSDLFHDDVSVDFIYQVLQRVYEAYWHKFQVLTKRPERMREIMNRGRYLVGGKEPMKNLWLGVTTENQECADTRIPDLLRTPAAVRFVSVEPMLGPVSIMKASICGNRLQDWDQGPGSLDWVIIGCESGPQRRPMELEWALDLVRQCQAAGVACFVKQVPINGKVSKDPSAWPEALRVREYPK